MVRLQLNPDLKALSVAASRLVGADVTALDAAAAGANSHLYRVSTAHQSYALKHYPDRDNERRDRLGTEWRALTFLRGHGFDAVPAPLACDRSARLLLMEWIEGTPVTHHDADDIDSAAHFAATIFARSTDPEAAAFSKAAEACLSAAEILRQIDHRSSQFRPDPTLDEFVTQTFVPALDDVRTSLDDELRNARVLAPSLRRLIPADFGFHNALRETDGRLRFFDFDYFGWDDPAKLTADFLLHPGMQLTDGDRNHFLKQMIAALPDDSAFAVRLDRHLPLYALRWALIVLNPFRFDREATLPTNLRTRRALLEERIATAQRVMQGFEQGHGISQQWL